MAGQVLTLADDQAAQIAQEAQDDAAAIRGAAEREAAAIREAAQREAAELRARLDTMLGDLGQVVAAYIANTLATPEGAMAAPARPKAEPGRLPGTTASLPAATPVAPDTTPGTRPATPANPRTRPAGPRTAPAKKPQQKSAGRQKTAMRIAKYSTAALLVFALGSSAAEIGAHGYKFFVFRENGQGDSPTGPSDPQFLAQQAKAAHAAPKGRHHKAPSQTATSTTHG